MTGKEYMGRVASLRCVLCARLGRHTEGVQVHHIREGQGMAQRAADWLVLPTCQPCHTGPFGLHGSKQLLRQAKCTELDLLADVIRELMQ